MFAQQAKAGRRHDQRQDPRQHDVLRRPVPEVAVLDRLLGHAQLPLPGRGRQPAERRRTTRRTGNDPKFNALYAQALKTADAKKRADLIHEMQKIEYNTGGYIVWGFYNLLDAYSKKVMGFKPSKGVLPLGGFGNGFRTISFA